MNKKYVRDFGGQPNTTAMPAVRRAASWCESCGKYFVAARPVFLEYMGQNYEVCQRNVCLRCGHIPVWRNAEDAFPAFWTRRSNGSISVHKRDFFLPRELYETEEGKADVGLKVRLISALIRLAQKEPTNTIFSYSLVEKMLK